MKISIDKTDNISVIIPNYRSKCYLRKNLLSIYDKVGSQIYAEVIIVNNDEKENLEDIKKEFPSIQLIDHKKNIGFGAAVNLGVQKASGRYLFFLNPDCKIISQNVKKVINELKTNKKAGIIGSKLVKTNNKIQKWIAGKELNLLDLVRNNLGFPSGRKIWENNKKSEACWVSGAAMFIKKELFEEAGGFDEKFFMYFEDVDLCKRIRKLEKNVYFFPDFEVMHLEGGSFENRKNQKKYYFDSQKYYFKKHNGKMESCILRILQVAFKLK